MTRTLILLLMLCAPSAFAAEQIGRLFSTPTERSNLEYLRETKKNIPVKAEVPNEAPVAEIAPVILPDAINMQGYVKRNDGKQGTVWVNDKALQEGTGNKDVQIGTLPANGLRVPIRLPANGRQLSLKAGQVYDPESNRVHEARSRGNHTEAGRIGDEAAQ